MSDNTSIADDIAKAKNTIAADDTFNQKPIDRDISGAIKIEDEQIVGLGKEIMDTDMSYNTRATGNLIMTNNTATADCTSNEKLDGRDESQLLQTKDQQIVRLVVEMADMKIEHASKVYSLEQEIHNLRQELSNLKAIDMQHAHQHLPIMDAHNRYLPYPHPSSSKRRRKGTVLYNGHEQAQSEDAVSYEHHEQHRSEETLGEYSNTLDEFSDPPIDPQIQASSVSRASQVHPFDQSMQAGHDPEVGQRPQAYRFIQSLQSSQTPQAGLGIPQGIHAQLGVNIPTVPYKISDYLQPGGIMIDQIDDFIASNQVYDPLWIQRIGVSPSIFDTFTSSMKWSDFFPKVFHVGDRFDFNFWANGKSVEKSATVQSRCPGRLSTEASQPGMPPLSHHTCSSLQAFARDLLKGEGTVNRVAVASRDVHVYRNGVCLGNLHQIKMHFHLWQEEHDQWAVKTGNFALRHSRRGKPHKMVNQAGLTWEDGLWREHFPNGQSRTLPNQLIPSNRFNATNGQQD